MSDLLTLCTDLPMQVWQPNEVIIVEGLRPGQMWVLESGAVTVEKDGVAFAHIDHPGAIFGEMSWVMDRPASATVKAQKPTVMRVISDPDAFFDEHPKAAVTVLRMTASRLDGLTQYLVDVKGQFADLEGHLGMVDRILDSLVHHQGQKVTTGSARDPECC